MMRDTLAGQMWPYERICRWLWRLWVPQLYGSAVSEVVAKGKISRRVVEELDKGASHSSWINWLYGGVGSSSGSLFSMRMG